MKVKITQVKVNRILHKHAYKKRRESLHTLLKIYRSLVQQVRGLHKDVPFYGRVLAYFQGDISDEHKMVNEMKKE